MAELYAKPYEVIDTGYNPQQTQQGGQDAEMQSYLESLPPEERQKAIERINAPLSGEELALMAQSGQKAPTLQEYAEIEKYHKNQEISFIDGLGRIAEGGEQVMTDLSNAFASFLSDPKDATSKMPATAVEAFAQGTRNFYGMLAQSGNPDSTLFRVKDFLNGSGTIEDRYNQYMEALKFNKESADLAEGKMTMVMDKDMINHEVTQAMAYIADPTLFIPFGKVASTGLRAVGLGERLAMAGARSAAIKNGILGNTIKWGAGQPLEFMGGAVRNTIDYGLEKAGAALETTTGINAKEFAQTARMSGIGFSASAVAGYSIPFASTVSDAYIVGSSAKGFGEALTLVGETMKKNPFGRGVRSWAAESLKQAEKNGVALSPHAKGLLRTLDAVDPLFAYGWNGLESAAEGAMIGGGLGYLSGGEEGMYSGIGAGVALGAIGGTAGKMVADVTGGTNIARRAVQAKMTIEGQKVINPDKAMFFQGMQTAAKARGKDVDLVNSIIIGIDEVAPNFEFHALTPEQFEIEAKRKGFDPETGKFRETSALDVEFGGDRASKSKAMYVLRSVGADFVGNRQGFLDALKKAYAKDSANPNKTASNIPLALRKYTDVAKTFEKLSKTQQEAILKEIDEQGTKAKELGGTTKLREFYDALTWSEAWTDSLVKKFESNREGARKDITDMLAQETDKKGKLTSKGRALTDKLRAEGFLDKEGKLLRERNLLQADLTLSQFEQHKGAVIGREADGKTHMYINLTRMGDETFPHELFHTIMRESPMKKYFTDSLVTKLLGTVDKDGKLSRPAEVNIGQVQKFFKKYIDLTHRNDDGTLDAQASEAKFKLVQEALTEYQNAGSNKQISDKARGLLENYSEEFGAYYFSHWLMGRNRNTLFFGGELKGIEGLVERTKDSFKDFWQSKISKSNPEFDFSNGLNESFDRSKGLGRIASVDYYMRDMVRAASNANREAFRPDAMTLDNLKDFERSNGIRNLTSVEGTRRLNPREQVTQNIRLGKEAFKILSGVDKAMRTSKDVIDENGKQVITGRLSETELDALVKGGIVPRAWADKVNQGYAMLDGTISNVFSAGYLGKTEQTTDASYPRLTGKDVAFKNRKAVLFDVETKVKADGTFYTLFHTLDLAVIEQEANRLFQNTDYRALFDGDRAVMEADFFRYLSNASKASTDPSKKDSAALLEKGDGLGAQRRDVMHQMGRMALQTGDAYKHQPIAVIPEGFRHSVTTFNIDGMTMPRVETGARYDIDMGNAHKFIRENWQPDEMKQEKTPSGVLMTHESGFKFSNLNGKTTAYTSAGRKIGAFNSIREAINAGKKEYNDIYKKHPLDIAKALYDSEQKISRYQPLEPHERKQAIALGDVFEVPSVKKFIEGLPFLRQTREEFILDKANKAIKGDPEKLWKLAQEKAKPYEQLRDNQNKLSSEMNRLQQQIDSYYKERKVIEDTFNDIKNINSFGKTIPYNSFFPDYVLARYNRTSLKDNVALREIFKKHGIDYGRHSDAYGQLHSPEQKNEFYEPFRKSLHDALNSQEFSDWYNNTTHSITLDLTSGIGKNSFDLQSAEKNLLSLRGEYHKLTKKQMGSAGLERLFNVVQQTKDHVRYQSESNLPEGLRITEAEAFKNSTESVLQSSSKRKWSGHLEELFASEYDANIQTGKPIVAIGTHGTKASAVLVSRMLLDERLGTRYTNAGSAHMGHFFASSQSTSSSYAENLSIKSNYFASEFILQLSELINLHEKKNPIVIGDSKYEKMVSLIDDLRDANLKIGNGVYEWGRDALKSSSDAFLKDTEEIRAKLEKIDATGHDNEVVELKRSIYESYQKRIRGLVDALGQYSDASLDLFPYDFKVILPDSLNALLDKNNTRKQTLGYLDRIVQVIEEGNAVMNEKTFKNTFLDRYNALGVHEIKISAKELFDRTHPFISIEKSLEEKAGDWKRIRTHGTNKFYKLIDSSVVRDSNLYLNKAFNEFMDKVYQIDKEFPFESLDDLRLLKNSENGKFLAGGKQIRSLIKLKNPKVVLDPRSYEEYHLYPHMAQAQTEGHDGIIFQKLDDGGQVQDTIFVVFKGNQDNIKTIDTTADKEAVPRGKDENGEEILYGKRLGLAFQPTDEGEAPKQIQGIKLDMTKAYDVFRKEYEESTGQSWTQDKFMQRASNWQFFGDENGFVAVRPQRSGFVKLVGMAGDNKSKLRGIQQLQEQKLPVWGMVSKDIKDIAVKRGMREPNMIERAVLKKALNSAALGDAEILGYTPDNGVRLRYPDIGEVTKYMIGSPEYYQKLRSAFGEQVKNKIGFQPTDEAEGGRVYDPASKEFRTKFIGKWAEENPERLKGYDLEFIDRGTKYGTHNVRIRLQDNSTVGMTQDVGHITADIDPKTKVASLNSNIGVKYRGNKLSYALYSEMAERLRSMGVQKVDGTIINPEGIPIKVREKIIGNTRVLRSDGSSGLPIDYKQGARIIQRRQAESGKTGTWGGLDVVNELDFNARYQPTDYQGGDDYYKPKKNIFESKDEQGFLIRSPFIVEDPNRPLKKTVNPNSVSWDDIGHFYQRLTREETGGMSHEDIFKWENENMGLWAEKTSDEKVVIKDNISARKMGYTYTHREWFQQGLAGIENNKWGRYEKPIYDKAGNLVRRGRISITSQYRGQIKNMKHAYEIKNRIAEKLKFKPEDADAYLFDASDSIKQSMGFSSKDTLPIKFQPAEGEQGEPIRLSGKKKTISTKKVSTNQYEMGEGNRTYNTDSRQWTNDFIGRYAEENPILTKGIKLSMKNWDKRTDDYGRRSIELKEGNKLIGRIDYEVKRGSGGKWLLSDPTVRVWEQYRGKGYSNLLYSEMAERARFLGAEDFLQRIENDQALPMFSQVKTFGFGESKLIDADRGQYFPPTKENFDKLKKPLIHIQKQDGNVETMEGYEPWVHSWSKIFSDRHYMPAEYTEFKSEQSATGRILRNAKGYVIMLANNKFRVYNPAKAIIGVYGSEEEAKKRIYKEIPKR